MTFSNVNKHDYEQELLSRWNWITDGIKEAETKLNTSIVLESSYGKMISDGSIPRSWLENNILNEDTLTEAPMTAAAVGDYVIPKVMFPIIRRVMPELIANKIVSVQPITQPTGVIYYINYKYTNTKGGTTAADEFTANPQQTSQGNGFGTYYSSEKIGPFDVTCANAAAEVAAEAGKATNANGIVTTNGTQIINFLGTPATTHGVPPYTIKRFEAFNVTTGRGLTVKFTSTGNTWDGVVKTGDNIGYDSTTGIITLGSTTVSGLSDLLTVSDSAYPNTYDKIRLFLIYDMEGSSKVPEMEFAIDYSNITTTERKLKARWTKESEQDMQAYHKIDVESELVKVTALQTNYEIDREIVTFISDRVLPTLSFTHDWNNDTASTGNNTAGNFLDRHRAFAQKLYLASTTIAQYNKQGPATWAVTSPQTASLMQMLPDFKGEISTNKNTMYNAGNLGGNLQIYVDPNRFGAGSNEVILGYKSTDSTYGAGVVYSPYANWMSSTITHPDTFDSIRGFFSRYAITMVPRGEYHYARVQLGDYGLYGNYPVA